MDLFYAPGLVSTDKFFTLDREESNHCLRSVRRAEGQTVTLTNGRGLLVEGGISGNENGLCVVEVQKVLPAPNKGWKLEMAVAPTKNMDRFEWYAEKATEMGIDAIYPMMCRHSERRKVQNDRLNRLLVAAMKQSQQAYLPLLFPAMEFAAIVAEAFNGQKLIAFYGDGKNPKLAEAVLPGKDVRILVGPEGDFSEEEIGLAEKNGYTPISLGKNRLRTETAALVACCTVNMMNG